MLESLVLSFALTTHVGVTKSMNNYHPNIGYYISEDVVVGAYYNSEKKVSTYIGKDFNFKNFDISAGLATGYASTKVLPYVIFSKQLSNKFSVFVIPTVDGQKKSNPALVFGIGYQFN